MPKSLRETIEFPYNLPVALALKFPQGKAVGDGTRVMYSTIDNRVMFLDLEVAEKLEELNPQPSEALLVTRLKANAKDPITWLFQRQSDLAGQLQASLARRPGPPELGPPAVGPQPEGGFKVPAFAPGVSPSPSKPVGQAKTATGLVEAANALVDAYAQVLDRALTQYQGRVKPDEVRSLLISAYIQRGKVEGAAA